MIYCIGRNYSKHAKELGNQMPEAPVVFFKPPASVVPSGETVTLPSYSKNVQFEVELALKVDAHLNVSHFTVANDLTARDKQREAQESKTPWSLAKGFKQSCGLGAWLSVKELADSDLEFSDLELTLTHNGKLAQKGHTRDMMFDIPTILKFLKNHFPLQPNDIILTGTPEGVATLKAGDEIVAEITGFCKAQWSFR